MSKSHRSAVTVALIAGASELGYQARVGFQAAVDSARRLVPSNYLALVESKDTKIKAYNATIQAFGDAYKAGHVVGYLEPHYARRWGNLDMAGRVIAAGEILAKAEPESEKADRRTELEHKACRAAISAWSHLKGEAGLKKPTQKKAQTGASKRRAAGDEKPVPSATLTAPKFVAPVDALSFYQRLSTDLGKAVNANALATPIAIKSAVEDFRKALRTAIAAVKAGETRSAKVKADKTTVSAAAMAPKAPKANGASVN